jgi:thiol-disulfide isomerase/thioredoxin
MMPSTRSSTRPHRPPPALRAAAACLAAAVALAALAPVSAENPPAGPAPGAPSLRDFEPTGDYVLILDGQQTPAELFHSQLAGAMLIVSPAFPAPVLLKATKVSTVEASKLDRKPDGSIDVQAGAALTAAGTYEVGNEVHFTFAAHQAALREVPALLGMHGVDEVTAHNPEYRIGARNYHPDPRAVAALKLQLFPVTVRIVYGSWCGHCRSLVPHAVKLEQLLAGTSIAFEYLGVGNPATDPEAKKLGVVQIPTAVVYVNGHEVGRVVSDDDWNALELALRRLLAPR